MEEHIIENTIIPDNRACGPVAIAGYSFGAPFTNMD